MSAPENITSDKVMRLCRHCAEIARERKIEEADEVCIETVTGKLTLAQIATDFANHLAKETGAWGNCDSCSLQQMPNPNGPTHEGKHAPLAFFRGEPKDLKTLYTIAARVFVNGEWKPYLEQCHALNATHARRIWTAQFQGPGNWKPYKIDAIGPTLGFYVNDKDGKDLSTT